MSNFQVYADGGRLVAESSNYGQMAATCLVEMKQGRHSCGVYQRNGDGLLALFELSRDDRGRVHQWHRVAAGIPIDSSIPGIGMVELFHHVSARHHALVLQMRQARARLAELNSFANSRTSKQSGIREEIERCRELLRTDSIVAMTLRDVGRQMLGIVAGENDDNPFDPGEVDY